MRGLLIFASASMFVVIVTLGCVAYLYYGRLWFRTRVASLPVPLGRMLRMTRGGVSASRVVNAYLAARTAGLEVDLDGLEAHERARGQVRKVVQAMLAAEATGGAELSFGEACAMDLRGNTDREAVKNSK